MAFFFQAAPVHGWVGVGGGGGGGGSCGTLKIACKHTMNPCRPRFVFLFLFYTSKSKLL